jgi:hypothetical protein
MAELRQCEFFLLRYVPDAVKDEFVNIGVALVADGDGPAFAELRLTRDWRRVKCLDAGADVEMLEAMAAEAQQLLQAGGEERERLLHLLRDSFSNMVQATAAQAVLTESPAAELEKLVQMYLETRRRAGVRENVGRGAILERMRDEFERAGVWTLMRKRIAAADYTHKGDPLKIDCGYRPNGVIRFFQATSLGTDVDAAKVLAFSFPRMARGVERIEGARAELTAIVEDDLDRDDEQVAFALAMMQESSIAVAPAAELGRIAERARVELRV